MLSVGLRFRRGDARILDAFADRVRRGELMGDVGTFEQAAQAARNGEPLQVVCESEAEAHAMAALYARVCGLRVPAVEELSGT